ncbi:MAG TPA: hypothetical protein ENJ82_14090 [Bacteroidetes bacterium]|nr:hypothetical protein [Bacteroidota bacterium]
MAEIEPIEILRMRDIAVLMRAGAADDFVELIEGTTWGTPGGTRYQHVNTGEKVREVPNPYFLELRKGERLMGGLCLAQRTTLSPTGDQNAFYIRYLSVMDAMQRKSTKDDAGKTSGMRANGLLKRVLKRFFANPKELLEETKQDHAVIFAYVELENERSQDMTKMMGFEPIGKFSTIVFSRFFPKKDSRVRRLPISERPKMETILKEAYQDYALFSTQNLFYKDNYWVLEENGETIAGLQANLIHWVITEMPGFSGKMIMNLIPRLPLLKRMFNPKKYEFVVIDGIYCKPGREKALHKLLAHACVENGVYSAIMWLDHLDPLYTRLMDYGKLGLLNKVNGDTPASIIAQFVGMSAEDIDRIKTKPRYISAFDST